jgi:replicative DNA helicase
MSATTDQAIRAEQAGDAVLACFVRASDRIADYLNELGADGFHHREQAAIWRVMRRMHEECAYVTSEAIRGELADIDPSIAIGCDRRLTRIVDAGDHSADLRHHVGVLRDLMAKLAAEEADRAVRGDHGGEVVATIERAPRTAAAPPPRKWHRAADIIDTIERYAAEPWISLRLGQDLSDNAEIVRVRAGGIVVVMGPTGGGKTSLVAGMLIAHARDHGPVVVLSRELPMDEFGARMIGMQCDASWPDTLTGRVQRSDMERVLSPRLFVLDRRNATLVALSEAIEAAQAEFPGEPVLVAVDYIQIINSTEREARAKVGDVIDAIDDITRCYRTVTMAISQMSRASSRAARAGEALGADSTDGGAESAAIERVATVTLSIGASGPHREDGSPVVDLSIGKGRMTGGDRVLPMSYDGRTGRWRITGASRPAAEVKAERDGRRADARQLQAELAIAATASKSPTSLTRAELGSGAGVGSAPLRTAAIKALLERGGLVEVRQRANPRGVPAWKVWTRERAVAADVEIIERGVS